MISRTIDRVEGNPLLAGKTSIKKTAMKVGIKEKKIKKQMAGTGIGIKKCQFVKLQYPDIVCISRGVSALVPSARTIIDVGAEEARAVKCDDNGIMMDFVVNERCAAGAGAFIEAMARALEVKLEDMGPLSLKAERASSINASCVIFGESDVVSLIHKQESKPEIARAIFEAMADRISSMVHRLGVNPDVVLVGGVAKDVGFVASLKRKLAVDILIPEYPEYVGAFGAALVAAKRAKKVQEK